jgi:hypothetical protein
LQFLSHVGSVPVLVDVHGVPSAFPSERGPLSLAVELSSDAWPPASSAAFDVLELLHPYRLASAMQLTVPSADQRCAPWAFTDPIEFTEESGKDSLASSAECKRMDDATLLRIGSAARFDFEVCRCGNARPPCMFFGVPIAMPQ